MTCIADISCAYDGHMETNQTIKMHKADGIFITAENDFAVMHDSRNWWIVAPIIDGAVQYGSNNSAFINGTYRDAVNHIAELRNK
jgi:hypothetical protein